MHRSLSGSSSQTRRKGGVRQQISDEEEVNVNSNEFLHEEVRKYMYLEEVISGGDQDSPMSDQELNAKVRAMEEQRQASDNKQFRSMEKHPRCAILSSPEKLDESIGSPGSDETDTLRDFQLIKDWVTMEKLLNTEFYDTTAENQQGQLENCIFGTHIEFAFSKAFDAMRNTANPELEELVFWYYAGHGLGKDKAKTLLYSSTPCLKLDPNYNAAANDFVKEGRRVQGGELCLHKVGFCDLYGLLKPWIAAVKSDSINARGMKKKNKHLVIILDSCYSGIIAQQLNDFKELAQEKDATLLGENTVTIQAACGRNERALGGYFTPCFVYLNDPKNVDLLNQLKTEWENMTEETRNEYKPIDFQSPMVVTTRPQSTAQSQDATMELTVQNFKLTLFQDPGFFKFCSMKVYQDQDKGEYRVLNQPSAKAFMNSMNFIVLDYKLKTYQGTGPHAGTPMGLFLLDDPNKKGFAVCAHIHFAKGDTSKPQRINLVHHKKPPMGSTLYIEDHDGLSQAQINRNQHKIPVTTHRNASKLVQACYNYVNTREPQRWADVSQWNMTGMYTLGVNGMFRQQERSAWEESYLKHIEKYNLPKVANT
ncbi:hypothetical protein OS493_000831 [Desmophyllum pertusum]|uniref:Uncharacterized protein n=1 Tax=Desmophyllum pertusum TaxID=174260 RepID=A0A9W9ZTD8_9CNID|nr:hypothetical protein OS493_000831 [Desmophyllum pertusum]